MNLKKVKMTLLSLMEINVLAMFKSFLKFKVEERKNKNKIVEYNLQLHAHNGSGFDIWIILNNLPCDKHIAANIKNGKGISSLGVFNGYVQNKENKFPNISILDVV